MPTMDIFIQALLLCLVVPLAGHAEGLLAVDNPAKNGEGLTAYGSFDAFEGNDQVAMREYGRGWRGAYSPRNGNNLGLLSFRTEAGVQSRGYRFGGLYRAEALVQANRDTSDLAHQNKNRTGYDIGRTYSLDYRMRGYEVDGARLSKSFELALSGPWQVNWGLGLAYLRGKRIKLETASGHVVTLNTKDFNANAIRSNTNSKIDATNLATFNPPFGRVFAPSAEGYALDVGMVLRHPDSGVSLELAVADLAGRMDWKNLPNNVTDYNTATKYYDADGYVHFTPLATRTSSYRNVRQNLDPKLWLAANYPISDFAFQGAASYQRGYWFPQVGIKYRIDPRWNINADYDFYFNTLGLSLQNQWFYIGLRTDSVNLARAKAYGLNAGLNIAF